MTGKSVNNSAGTEQTFEKIVLFADGTGNSASSPHKTNVWRAYKALDTSPEKKQRGFYDGGVGTSAFRPLALVGLAFGWGLAKNVRQLYAELCRNYRYDKANPDNASEIYAFGFSRGAFTIRILVGMIARQGIIDMEKVAGERDLQKKVNAVYREFRREAFAPSAVSSVFRFCQERWRRLTGSKPYKPEIILERTRQGGKEDLIQFVGVWDTVDAYGLPIDEMTWAWDKVVWPLQVNDRNLSPRVVKACHALALDERRKTFEPMLWNERIPKDKEDNISEYEVDPRITQIWFPGVHTSVGGGNPDDSLSYISLNWMLGESGLAFYPDDKRSFEAAVDPSGPIVNNRSGAAVGYRYAPRDLGRLCKHEGQTVANKVGTAMRMTDAQVNNVFVDRPKLHHTIFDRIKDSAGGYAPINVPANYAVVDAAGVPTGIDEADSAAKLLETPDEAAARFDSRHDVWAKVRSYQLVHYITVLAVILFALTPGLLSWLLESYPGQVQSVSDALHMAVGTLMKPIAAIPSLIVKIPGLGMLEDWAGRFSQVPWIFLFFFLGIGWLLLYGNRVQNKIHDEMRGKWVHVFQADESAQAPAEPGDGQGGAQRDAATRDLRDGFSGLLRAVSFALFAFMVLVVASRIAYPVLDGFGAVCGELPEEKVRDPAVLGADRPSIAENFSATDPCFATGFKLVKGERYHLRLEVPPADDQQPPGSEAQQGATSTQQQGWADAGIDADVRGWLESRWYMNLFVPLRRHMFARWYQPVARIDDTFFDRYVLEHTGGARVEGHSNAGEADPACASEPGADEPRIVLCTTIRARNSGQLFIYVNDAVLFYPWSSLDVGWLKWLARAPFDYYANNSKAEASLQVFHVPRKDEAAD